MFFFLKMIRCCLCIWLNKKIRKDDDLSSTIGNKKMPLDANVSIGTPSNFSSSLKSCSGSNLRV